MEPRSDAAIMAPHAPGEAAPPPSWMEAAKANLHLIQDDEEDYGLKNQIDGYKSLEDELVRLGRPRARYNNPAWSYWYGYDWTKRQDQVWADVSAARAVNPKAFADIPGSQEEFNTWAARRMGQRDRDQQVAARGGFGTSLAPGLGFGLLRMGEPQNLLAIPMGGGGRTAAGVLLRQFGAGAAFTVATTPQRAKARADMGEGYSGDQLGFDALMGGAVNAGFVGLHMGYAKGGKLAYEAMPLDWRLAQQLKREVPLELRSPQQQAAIHVVERAAEVDATNPYPQHADWLDAHSQKLQGAMDELEAAPRAAAPVAAPEPVRPAGRSRVGAYDPAMAGDQAGAIAGFKAKIRRAESPTDTAKNPESSAQGRYQFTDGTWLEYYGKVFGQTGESRAAVLAKKTDGTVQEKLMDRLTLDHVAALRRANAPVTVETLYMLHFAGEDGGLKLLRAADATPIREVLGNKVVNANRFLDGMTAAEARAELARRVGGEAGPAVPGGAGDVAAPTAMPERPAAMDAVRPVADGIEAVRPEVIDAALPGVLRPLVSDRARSLNDTAGLASELGVTEEQLRGGLDQLVSAGELVKTGKGLYRRPAQATGPEDMLRFLARRGGLSPDGFSEAQRARNLTMDNPPRGHDLKNSGNLDHFVPGSGPLLRKTGMGLDEAGQALWDAGYFGPVESTPRPTEAELITLLDQVIGRKEKRYSFNDVAPEAKRVDFGDDAEAAIRAAGDEAARRIAEGDHWHRAGEALGLPGMFPDDIAKVRAIMDTGFGEYPAIPRGELPSEEALAPYIAEMVNREIDSVLEDAYLEIEDPAYDFAHDGAAAATAETGRAGSSDAGSAPEQGSAGQGAAGARAGTGAERLDPATRDAAEAAGALGEPIDNPAARQAFDDPDGAGIKAAADSIWHDLRAELGQATLPPVQKGYIRMWHGGMPGSEAKTAGDGGRWFSSDRAYAAGFGNENGKKSLYYVDIPSDHPIIDHLNIDEFNNVAKGRTANVELPNDIAVNMRQVPEVLDPAIAERQRQQAQLGAEAPLRAKSEQDGTMGAPLFDAADQPKFDLGDGKGERTIAEIDAELTKGEQGLDAIRGCLK